METATQLTKKQTIDTLNSQIEDSKRLDYERHSLLVSVSEHCNIMLNAALINLQRSLSDIVSVLEKFHLEIETLNYHKTGKLDVWAEDDKLSVSLRCAPLEGFKFIAFAGYTSRGAGKNQKQLLAKANKIATTLKEKAMLKSVSVNQFSLEAKGADNKTVLIDIIVW